MRKIESKTLTETIRIEDPSRALVLDEMETLRNEDYRCSNLDIDIIDNGKEQQGVYFFIAKKKTVTETVFSTVNEGDTMSGKHLFIIKPLFAIADKDGYYIDVSRDIAECQKWLKENNYKEAKTIIGGYGVFNSENDMMADNAADFHYTYEEAQHELSRFLEHMIR